jgi:hypothetical protein
MNLTEAFEIEQNVAGCQAWLESWHAAVRPRTPIERRTLGFWPLSVLPKRHSEWSHCWFSWNRPLSVLRPSRQTQSWVAGGIQADLVHQLFNSGEKRLAPILQLMAEFGTPK